MVIDMAPDIGNLFLYIALIISIIISISPLLQFISPANIDIKLTKCLWLCNFAAVSIAFCCLIYSYIISDFSVLNVANNSHLSKPLIYKLTGAWGNHEGSMLLWIISVSFFSVAFAWFGKGNKKIVSNALAIQGVLSTFFIGFVIFASNPFQRIFPVPINGRGLNPILQDIGLAFHPPMLYLGYVGFSIAYSSTIAALLNDGINAAWARLIRPWVLLSWSFLTLGIGLGSWWAYRELGWGGFWFWDPVENSSLMPWLTATALIHALIVCEKTDNLKNWSVLLAILTFTLSMVGTFIVRSGLITSVHSFAQDPERGLLILLFLGAISCFAFSIYAIKAVKLVYGGDYDIVSRETFISFNNLFLVIIAFIVIIGTLYPTILELITGDKISVGPPYFNTLFAPMIFGLLVLGSIGSRVAWRSARLLKIYKEQKISFTLAALITILLWQMLDISGFLGLLVIFASLWLILSTLDLCIGRKFKFGSSFYGMFLAHIGFGIAALSISLNASLEQEVERAMSAGDTMEISSYKLQLNGVFLRNGENYIARVVDFSLSKNSINNFRIYPETRFFNVEKQQTTESAISHHYFYDIYVAVGDVDQSGMVMVRAYYKPMMGWLWFSCFMMFIGGIYSLLRKLTFNSRA